MHTRLDNHWRTISSRWRLHDGCIEGHLELPARLVAVTCSRQLHPYLLVWGKLGEYMKTWTIR